MRNQGPPTTSGGDLDLFLGGFYYRPATAEPVTAQSCHVSGEMSDRQTAGTAGSGRKRDIRKRLTGEPEKESDDYCVSHLASWAPGGVVGLPGPWLSLRLSVLGQPVCCHRAICNDFRPAPQPPIASSVVEMTGQGYCDTQTGAGAQPEEDCKEQGPLR